MSDERTQVRIAQAGKVAQSPATRPREREKKGLVFLHSSYRTSSTWVWDRFRKLSGVTAYYEIFNEGLATIKRAAISAQTHASWSSGHPEGAAYLLEFAPLIADSGGVRKFDPAMSFSRFIPEAGVQGDISAAEKDYIAGLIEHAQSLGTVPVLSCTRTLGRMPGLKSSFPGLHLLIYRNLFRQWCSYTEQYAKGNRYFVNSIKACIDNSTHDSFCKCLKETFQLLDPKIDSSDYFCAFVLFHIYLYGHAGDAAELILDVEKAVDDEDYRALMEREIAARSGLAVDLSGIKARIAFSLLDECRHVELEDTIRVLADVAISSAPSAAGRQFAAKVLTDFLDEWDRFSFYAGTLSTFAGPRGLLRDREVISAERDALASARNTIAHERDAIVVERDTLRVERDALRGERDALVAARHNAERERSAVAAERDALRVERGSLRVERDALVAARHNTERERSAVVAERDALRVKQNALIAARDNAEQVRDVVVAERDTLRAEREALVAARDNAERQRNEVVAERDALRVERDDAAGNRDAARQELESTVAERDSLRAERNALAAARDTATKQYSAVAAERDALRIERAALAAACEIARHERDALEAHQKGMATKRSSIFKRLQHRLKPG